MEILEETMEKRYRGQRDPLGSSRGPRSIPVLADGVEVNPARHVRFERLRLSVPALNSCSDVEGGWGLAGLFRVGRWLEVDVWRSSGLASVHHPIVSLCALSGLECTQAPS